MDSGLIHRDYGTFGICAAGHIRTACHLALPLARY